MKDPDGPISRYPAIEVGPCRQVFKFFRVRVSMELLEASPVLQNHHCASAHESLCVQHTHLWMAKEFFEHSRHRPCYGPPSVQQKETIDPHPNYKYNELTFELRRVPTVIDVCSATHFPDLTSIFPQIQRSGVVGNLTVGTPTRRCAICKQ
jgi:hypothetical protein